MFCAELRLPAWSSLCSRIEPNIHHRRLRDRRGQGSHRVTQVNRQISWATGEPLTVSQWSSSGSSSARDTTSIAGLVSLADLYRLNGTTSAAGRPAMAAEMRSPTSSLSVRTGSSVRWRCGLSATDRQNHGVAARWDCRDPKFFVGRINFEQLGSLRASALNSIPTRFSLSRSDVETLISAGRDGLRTNSTFRAFLGSIDGRVFTAASSTPQ